MLGPINLNLLGLVIQTNQITLDISGLTGPGNLLSGIAAINLAGLQSVLLSDLSLLLNQLLGFLP